MDRYEGGRRGKRSDPGRWSYATAGRIPARVSVSVDTLVIPPSDDTYLEDAWDLKERIRRRDGVLKQRRNFFVDAYRQATTHAIRTTDEDPALVGFASTREGGYLLFLAVAPEYQGMGYGRDLVAAVAGNHDVVTCHARVSNDEALEFYRGLGFEVIRRIDNYYEDGGDAYFLRLGEETSLTTRLAQLFRR